MRRLALFAVLLTAAATVGLPVSPRAHAAAVATPTTDSAAGRFAWSAHPVTDDASFGEPSIDVDHANNIYVTAPGGGGVQLWRSTDRGHSFERKSITSSQGGHDSEIEFNDKDVGFTADLRVADSTISRSTDRFETWTQQSVGVEQDRQWLSHFCEKIIYFAYHDFVAGAELINKSVDGGVTWDKTPTFISPGPGNQDNPALLADQGVNTFSGPVVVDQKTGDIYVVFAISTVQGNTVDSIVPPYGQAQQILMGVSHNGGQSFEVKVIHGTSTPGAYAGLIFPWATIDKAGNVYASWAGRANGTDPFDVFLSHSTDHGEHWSAPVRINQDRGPAHIYTTISAGDPGVVDMAWYTGTKPTPDDTSNDWYVDFAQVRDATSMTPNVAQSRAYPTKIHHGDICLNGILCELGGDRSLLDFFQIQVGPDGAANIAFANNGSPDGKRRVWFVRQVSGPTAGNGLHDFDYCPGMQPFASASGTASGSNGSSVSGNTTVAAANTRRLPATGGQPWRLASMAMLTGAAGLLAVGRRPRRRYRAGP